MAQIVQLAAAWGMHGDFGWGWMALMMVFMVVFWGAVIFGVVWLVRGTAQGRWTSGGPPVTKQSPLDILERRFAEGAMTEQDYRARREVLLGGPAGPNGARKDDRVVTP